MIEPTDVTAIVEAIMEVKKAIDLMGFSIAILILAHALITRK